LLITAHRPLVHKPIYPTILCANSYPLSPTGC
jgi:hypothetical protein